MRIEGWDGPNCGFMGMQAIEHPNSTKKKKAGILISTEKTKKFEILGFQQICYLLIDTHHRNPQ